MKQAILLFCLFSRLTGEPFIVGTASGYAPFVSLNNQMDYEGFDIDVAKAIATQLNRPLQLKDCGNMPSLMLALKQNKVDALLWAISITESRKKTFELIHYQGDTTESIPLIFWDTIPEAIQSLEDLGKMGQAICVEAGSYQEEMLKTVPEISLKYLDGIQEVILDLKYGKSLASGIDPSLIPRFQKKYPELKVLSLPLPDEMRSEGNGICLNREQLQLIEEVRAAIAALKREGVIAQLEAKWGLSDE